MDGDYIKSIKKHVHQLSVEIGPRGSTTPEEKRAAEYAASFYKGIGLTPLIEPFSSAKSAWRPYALATILMLLAEYLFWLGGYAGSFSAALITIVVVVSLVFELSFKSNPIRSALPKGQSQNVSAVIDPSSDVTQSVVLVGHIDTHRMPLSHRSQRWLSFYSRLTILTFLSVLILLITYVIRLFFDTILLYPITLIPSIPVFLLMVMALSADRTQFSPGANDNATGAAIVMSIAERLTKEPLQSTRVWAVNTGCEEVGSYGASAWLESHIDELGDAVYLAIDNVGGEGANPCYLTRETLIFPFASDPDLIAMADKIAQEHPELGSSSREMRAAYTDGAIGIKAGLRCLTFVGYTPEGIIPNWHQPSDVFENVDWDTVHRTKEFIWLLIKEIDEVVWD